MNKPYLAISAAVVAVSFAPVLVLSCEASPLSIALYRVLFTALAVLPFVILRKSQREELRTLPLSMLGTMALVGVVLAAHFALWITSLTKTSLASSVVLVTAHPVLVAPVSHFLLRERLGAVNVIGIALSISGVVALVLGNYGLASFSIDTVQGNLLAILGGAAAGVYILGGRVVRKGVSVFPYVLVVNAVAALTLLPICLAFDAPIHGLPSDDYLIILLMAAVSGLVGHTLYNWSLGYLRASVASVFLLGEPILSSLLAFAFPWIAQQPSFYTVVGGVIIIGGIYLTTRERRWQPTASTEQQKV
jgi:drug/metabolite transporter (DMT)-like permease